MTSEPVPPGEGTHDPAALLAGLAEGGVDFILIGGLAAAAHGSRRITRDIDIVVRPDNDNLARLEASLAELGAVQLLPGAVEGPITAADIAMVGLGSTLHTRASAGRLDVVGAPAGAAPYSELRGRAIVTHIAGLEVMTSGLDDLIAMKRAAGRPLDLQDIADITASRLPEESAG